MRASARGESLNTYLSICLSGMLPSPAWARFSTEQPPRPKHRIFIDGDVARAARQNRDEGLARRERP